MAERSFGTTLKNLFLALLNATLILIALCLFLAWQTVQSLQDVTEAFADRLVELAPLREDLQKLTSEGAALRGEFQALRTAARTDTAAKAPELEARIVALDEKVSDTAARVNELLDAPEDLIFAGIDHGAAALTQSVSEIIGCTRPASTGDADLSSIFLPSRSSG
ncbi:MAG: hypothetical protein QNJ03_02235 [Dinoroseobacter sp.]|nr:hypothetical protein [Dinoroseobacter sp.]